MKILVLGSGLMGPAAAYNAMLDPEVSHVMLCDMSAQQLDTAKQKLARLDGAEKLTTSVLDLRNRDEAVRLMAGFDAVVACLPKVAIGFGLRAALEAKTAWVDLSAPPDPEVEELKPLVQAAGTLVISGCGVEPGLTEIMARHLAEKMDRVDEVHIKCGGIPEKPAPPLGYKIVFGGRQLPLRDWDARWVENGELKPVARYSGVEPVYFAGVGECEAWHEGFMPWLLDLAPLKGLKVGTQKTVRYPGFAAKVTLLKELGLLREEPVNVDGVSVAPKKVLDAVLYPRVRLEEGERDITVFRVQVFGEANGCPQRYTVEMVDRYDDVLGFTSMARTTAFTGAIVARMVARGDIAGKGWLTPEKVIAGRQFDELMRELQRANIHLNETMETTVPLTA